MDLRRSLHQVGAAAFSELLRYEEPASDQRHLPCPYGHDAAYVSLRSKTVSTVLGPVELQRPYDLCAHRGKGPFPVDEQWDMKKPGIRRGCGACRRWSARPRPSSTRAGRWNFWPVWRSPPKKWSSRQRPSERTSRPVRRNRFSRQHSAHGGGGADSDPVCAEGRHGSACGEESDRGRKGTPALLKPPKSLTSASI
jgi:hypothetical protein